MRFLIFLLLQVLIFFVFLLFLTSQLTSPRYLRAPKYTVNESKSGTEKIFQPLKVKLNYNWTEPIPVFVCNRPMALLEHVEKLLRLTNSFQDCDDPEVSMVIENFGDRIHSMKNPTDRPGDDELEWAGYHRIARHYKLALDRLFAMNYTSVIITEDDLAISMDFFNYFSNTRYLLDADPTLWCVSAWNDNGKSATLYRSDFFPGLGWMMTSRLWAELSPQWPDSYWDDWMRDPKRRKNRQCIRPENGRTAMTKHGLNGVSNGQLSDTHSNSPMFTIADFSLTSLDYLLPDHFRELYFRQVYNESVLIKNFEDLSHVTASSIRFEYDSRKEFEWFAKELGLIHDEKAGVPRTAYDGIVTCYVKDRRIYLTPDRSKIPDYSNYPVGKPVNRPHGIIYHRL